MNAVVALCHFCEAHGPGILFCTQSFHSAHDAQLMMDAVPPDKRLPLPDRPDSRASDTSSVSSLIQAPPAKSEHCEACRSIPPDEAGFVSYDTKANICYISQQHPEQPQLYSVVRQACVRSLNCEVCPGREGPIAFGEDGSSHALSYTFNIKDSQARGFTRLYSLVVVMMDRVFLINSWPFLVKHFRALIDDLQGKAECVYSREIEESKQHTSRSLRSSVSSTHGHDPLRRIRAKETGRSLVDLTGDGGIFRHLHRYFVFLLKAGGLRITECVLEGPPRVVAAPETSGETSDCGSSTAEALERPLSAADFRTVEEEGVVVFRTLRQVFHSMDKASFQYLATHILKGNQVIVRGKSVPLVTSLINTLKDLVPEKCCQMVAFSKTYKESFVCNFLGLSSRAEVPKHVTSSDLHVIVEIFPIGGRVGGVIRGGLGTRSWDGGGSTREMNPTSSVRLVVQSGSRSSETRAPLFLTRLMALLSSDVLSDATVSGGLSALKEEWMNKVKVLYKFSQMGHLEIPQKNERLTKLLHEILYVGYDDLPILQYWRAALTKEYKTHLIQTART